MRLGKDEKYAGILLDDGSISDETIAQGAVVVEYALANVGQPVRRWELRYGPNGEPPNTVWGLSVVGVG